MAPPKKSRSSRLSRLRGAFRRGSIGRASTLSLANTALNRMEWSLGRTRLLSNPDTVMVEPTTACNLKCKMCGRQSAWKELARRPSNMRRETFSLLNPFLRTARLVVLHGFGESLMHADFAWMVRECKRHGCIVDFNTNGLLLDPDMCRELIDAGLDRLNISMDAATEATYKEIRGGSLARLASNLDQLAEIKEQMGVTHPLVRANFAVMKKNLHDIPTLVEFGHTHGATEIFLRNMVAYVPGWEDQPVFDIREEVEAVYAEAADKAEQLGVALEYDGLEERDGNSGCPYRSFAVMCDGSVGPCGAQRFVFGNIHNAPLRQLWNNEEYQTMRRQFVTREYPIVCQHCPTRTNAEEDHVRPELSYVEDTLSVRQWEFTDSCSNS